VNLPSTLVHQHTGRLVCRLEPFTSRALMNIRVITSLGLASLGMLATHVVAAQVGSDTSRWKQHDMSRPKPARPDDELHLLVTPAPRDAVVLFAGTDLGSWEAVDSGPARWIVRNGYMEVKPGAGSIQTTEEFGDIQLHVEWATPAPPSDVGQNRGNSGVYLMGRYEVQVLDSYSNEIYADGQAAAVYGQYPPLWNASLPPGEWQSYDIFFRRPRFGAGGQLLDPARMTLLHNGVLVQNNETLLGPTMWLVTSAYTAHGDAGPLLLQDHGTPVRFRNIWVRRMPDRPPPPVGYARAPQRLVGSVQELEKLTGTYRRVPDGQPAVVRLGEGRLFLELFAGAVSLDLLPRSLREFEASKTDASVVFAPDSGRHAPSLTLKVGGEALTYRRVQ
jgi:hypothetical protein